MVQPDVLIFQKADLGFSGSFCLCGLYLLISAILKIQPGGTVGNKLNYGAESHVADHSSDPRISVRVQACASMCPGS